MPRYITDNDPISGTILTPLLIVCAAVAVYALSYIPQTSNEAFQNTSLARSLVQGEGFQVASHPDHPPALTSDPGYPVILGVSIWLLGAIFEATQGALILNLLAAAGFLWVVWSLFVARIGRRGAAYLTVLVALTPMVGKQSVQISPEMLSAFLAMALLSNFHQNISEDGRSDGPWQICRTGFLSGLLILCNLFMVAVAVSIGISLVRISKYRQAAWFGLCVFLVLLPWCFWISIQEGESILTPFLLKNPDIGLLGRADTLDFVIRMTRNCWRYLSELIGIGMLPALAPMESMAISNLVSLSLAALVFFGVSTRMGNDWLGTYGMVVGFALMVWPWSAPEMLLTAIPLMWLGLYLTTREFVRRWGTWISPATLRMVGIALFLCFAIPNAHGHVRQIETSFSYRNGNLPPSEVAFGEALAWIRSETDEDDILMCISTSRVFAETNRLCIPPPGFPTPDSISRTLLRHNVKYVLSAPAPGHTVPDLNALLIAPVVQRYDEVFIPVFQSRGPDPVTIYAVSTSTSNRMAQQGIRVNYH
ncbi:MAG: hypothetical protein HOH43_04365 [Candidatus Latescibacteria bacterium]|jgi:hypothetical protein|nr:hypothetical protein [Candidatus Latescibacterota bacterium]